MAFKKHWVITLKKLNSALADVRAELDKFGFWNPRLANIDVYLTWFGSAYGWQHYRTSGVIEITAFSLCRLCEAIPGSESVPLRDIVRHEYAHAIADGNRGLMRSSQFRRAFGKHHDSDSPSVYSPDMHVSKYAAEDAGEDFAEVSMCYLKYSGKLPRRLDTPAIRKKWGFVSQLCSQIQSGKRRWAPEISMSKLTDIYLPVLEQAQRLGLGAPCIVKTWSDWSQETLFPVGKPRESLFSKL